MSPKPTLHVATDADVVRRKVTISETANGEDRREFLSAVRARLAKALDDPSTPAHALTAMAREVSAVDREIRTLDEMAEDDAHQEEASSADSGGESFDATAV